MEKLPNFLFTPDIILDIIEPTRNISIKGGKSELNYSFTLYDLYPIVPSLDAVAAYLKISNEYRQVNKLISSQLSLGNLAELPPASNKQEALSLLTALFSPYSHFADDIWQTIKANERTDSMLFHLKDLSPFPLRLASKKKLLHTLNWIDTNIKTKTERLAKLLNLSNQNIQEIAKSVLKTYCYLVKMHDYRLARSINFNYSMFFQDRILNLFFGDKLYHNTKNQEKKGKLANEIALNLVKNLSTISDQKMCKLSVFMGTIWTSSEALQQEYLHKPDLTLATIESKIDIDNRKWCRNDIELFLEQVKGDHQHSVAVILDDNGESVFDLALFQRFLNDTKSLDVIFIVNRYPISSNISLSMFNEILNDPFFTDLKQHITNGRASVIVEEQVFRSFEIDLLKKSTLKAISKAELTYIKGVNFFETFKNTKIKRFHGFVVHGFTSILLTGCHENTGIFVGLAPGQPGFIYSSPEHIQTLNQIKTITSLRKHGP